MKKIILAAIAVALHFCMLGTARADTTGLEQIKSALKNVTSQVQALADPADSRIETGFSTNGESLEVAQNTSGTHDTAARPDFFGLEQIKSVLKNVTAPTQAHAVPTDTRIETGFSPNGQALPLVLKTINSARTTLDVMAYSFTSAEVTRALLNATKRGVKLRIVVDHKHNFQTDRSGKPVSALSALTNAGAQVRSVSDYSIMHDKIIVADALHVQTGSFNYSRAAAVSNSENVLVLWNAKQVAQDYTAHFDSRWRQGQPFRGRGQ